MQKKQSKKEKALDDAKTEYVVQIMGAEQEFDKLTKIKDMVEQHIASALDDSTDPM